MTLTKDQAETIATEHNVIVDYTTSQYNQDDTEYGWQPIPEEWLNTTALNTADSLRELLDIMRNQSFDENSNGDEWCDLPVFGVDYDGSLDCVWSWDDTHLLVGGCQNELKIVKRDEY